jgi:hypothetical protein
MPGIRRVIALLAVFALPAFGQDQEAQRALIERDQRTEEFAARVRGASPDEQRRLENLGQRQLRDVKKDLPPELRAYERQKAAEERTLALPPPAVRVPEPEKPKPLP